MSADPALHVLAGPNGAGKTTFVEELLRPVLHLPFVNADAIATDRRASFIAETVFSHPSKVELIRAAKDAGYVVTLHVILIPEELAVARVASRVAHGGHSVPETKVRERFARLFTLVAQAIDAVDEAHVYDNSRAARPFKQVAVFLQGKPVGSPAWPAWTPPTLGRQLSDIRHPR